MAAPPTSPARSASTFDGDDLSPGLHDFLERAALQPHSPEATGGLSHEQSLAFTSLDAQREACEAMSQDVFAADLVVRGVEAIAGFCLRFRVFSISRGLCFSDNLINLNRQGRLREAEAYLATKMTFIERYAHGVPDLVGQLRLALPAVHRLWRERERGRALSLGKLEFQKRIPLCVWAPLTLGRPL